MVKFVYRVLPAFVFYADWIVPKKYDALTVFNVVFIRPSHRNDEGLLHHELTHVKQIYRTFPLFPLRYNLSKKYRLNAELEAYKVQLSYEKDKEQALRKIADVLATGYGLGITREEAYKLLKQGS